MSSVGILFGSFSFLCFQIALQKSLLFRDQPFQQALAVADDAKAVFPVEPFCRLIFGMGINAHHTAALLPVKDHTGADFSGLFQHIHSSFGNPAIDCHTQKHVDSGAHIETKLGKELLSAFTAIKKDLSATSIE